MDKALLARVEKQAWFHRYPRGWPILLFFLAAMGTVLAVAAIEHAETERQQLELDRNVTEIASGIQRRASENIALLYAGAALLSARPQVLPADFAEIAGVLHANGDRHGSLGVGWAQWLNAADVPVFESAIQSSGRVEYSITPSPSPGQRYALPIVYLSPLTEANAKAIGFDMFSDPVRRDAINAAVQRKRPTVSGRVSLMQDEGQPASAGFLMYMPVFGTESGRPILRGAIFSPFRAEEFLESAAALVRNKQFDIAIYDQEPDNERLLALRQWTGEIGPSMDRQIVVGDRRWILEVTMKRPATLSSLSRATLLFGLVLALLIMVIAHLIIKRAAEDRAVLEKLSAESAIRNSLTRELNHRVKNTLANVLSIVALTRRRSRDIDEFTESLIGRVRALSATHDLLSQSDWTNAPIRDVVSSELAPYMGEDESHVVIEGPDINLAPNDALSLGLAIHELATNAAKYGALKAVEGRVFVNWNLVSPDVAEVNWREAGGPPVQAPDKRGFGRDLLEKIVAHELKSDVDLRFEHEGVECTLHVPVRRLTDFALRRSSQRGTVQG
jgi:two-component sensor histidine kinase/CHASE1-domain containing sensor protein